MARVAAVISLIALGDSFNPSTLGPAALLAATRSPVRRVAAFTLGVFAVSLAAGVAITLGPGQLLLAALPHPRERARHVLELLGGVTLIAAAVALWVLRERLARLETPAAARRGRAAGLMGAGIMLVELPTALPYFAAIALVVGSRGAIPAQVVLLAIYNAVFVAPLLAIVLALIVWPERSARLLQPAAGWLSRHWPTIFAALAVGLGVGLLAAGAYALVSE
jgi:cytochrome c biogenesis protein CcdA